MVKAPSVSFRLDVKCLARTEVITTATDCRCEFLKNLAVCGNTIEVFDEHFTSKFVKRGKNTDQLYGNKICRDSYLNTL